MRRGPVTLADVAARQAGDGMAGAAAFPAPAGGRAPNRPQRDRPVSPCDGVMARDRLAGLVRIPRTAFGAGHIRGAEEP